MEQTTYDFVVSVLTKEAVSPILDVVEHPPEHRPYSTNRLPEDCYTSQDGALVGRMASELLAFMLELCPRGH
jgi:hypothetical protein